MARESERVVGYLRVELVISSSLALSIRSVWRLSLASSSLFANSCRGEVWWSAFVTHDTHSRHTTRHSKNEKSEGDFGE